MAWSVPDPLERSTIPRWSLVAIGFVLLSLLLLLLIPYAVGQRVEDTRMEIETTAHPARTLAHAISLALAREAIYDRGYFLTRDTTYLRRLAAAVTKEEKTLRELAALTPRLSPAVDSALIELERSLISWHEERERAFDDEVTEEEIAAAFPLLTQRFATSLGASEALAEAINRAAAERQRALARTSRLWSIAAAALALFALGSMALVVGFGRQLARLNRSLAEAVRSRNDLLAAVSHDLRNPLQSIEVAVSLLDMQDREPSEQKRLSTIRDAVRSMARLTDDLLDVGAIEDGRFAVDREPVEVAPLLEQVARDWRPRARAEGVSLECRPPTDLPPIEADPQRLSQVFGNLISNAIRATPEGGSIALGAEEADGQCRLWVADTGGGLPVPEEEADRLFDRFWLRRSGRAAGHGLGLAIVRGIVEAHGGSVSVRSRPGAGTRFHFTVSFAARPGDEAPGGRASARSA